MTTYYVAHYKMSIKNLEKTLRIKYDIAIRKHKPPDGYEYFGSFPEAYIRKRTNNWVSGWLYRIHHVYKPPPKNEVLTITSECVIRKCPPAYSTLAQYPDSIEIRGIDNMDDALNVVWTRIRLGI